MSDAAPAVAAGRAIVVGHGGFAEGLISAVAQISGMGDRLIGLSNTGMTPADIESAIRSHLTAAGARVIFTDLPSGSATIAARRVMRDAPGVVLVSGVNLATLLDFVFTSCPTPTEAARAAADRGRASLIVVEPT